MNLMTGERVLLESDNKELVLTTHRIRHSYLQGNTLRVTSIMLDAIQSCELRKTNHTFLLYLAFFSGLGGILFSGGNLLNLFIGLILALVLVGAYFATQWYIISISSGGSELVARASDMSNEVAEQFIDNVEAARDARLTALHSQ